MRIVLLLLIQLLVFDFNAPAQSGESLFKDKCSSCHKPDKKSIGPPLRNIRDKWEENGGNTELIYDWVRDWKVAITLGDPYIDSLPATFSGEMSAAPELTNEEIDAILDYVDNYSKKDDKKTAKTNTAGGGDGGSGKEEANYLPNYQRNLNIVIASMIVSLVLLISILVMAGAIRSILGSENYQKKMAEKYAKKTNGNSTKLMALLLLLIPASGFAQTAEPTEPPSETFYMVSNAVVWVAITVNLILLGVFLYMKYILKQIVESAGVKTSRIRFFKKRERRKIKWNEIFTQQVAIEKEEDILMDHEYDGIQELDNVLPPWWLWLFYGSIVFAVVYLFHFHVLETGDLQEEAYRKEVVQAEKDIAAYLESQSMNITAESAQRLSDGESLSKGKELYMQECVKCHGDNGQGGTGANLTDDYWIYGNTIGDVFETISSGGENGMASWKDRYNPQEIQQIASFVLSFDKEITEEMGGKAPEAHAEKMPDAVDETTDEVEE